MGNRPTYLSFLAGVESALGALRLNQIPGFEAEADDVRAFPEVRIYAHESIVAAIEDARLFADRLAFIVPTERRFENVLDGRALKSQQTVGCLLLMADRNFADRSLAAVGDASTPGVIALSELVLEQLIGADLGLAGVCLQPGDGQPFTLTTEEKDELTGREVWAQEFTSSAGAFVTPRARPGSTRFGP